LELGKFEGGDGQRAEENENRVGLKFGSGKKKFLGRAYVCNEPKVHTYLYIYR
jgi:hypothetical protein